MSIERVMSNMRWIFLLLPLSLIVGIAQAQQSSESASKDKLLDRSESRKIVKATSNDARGTEKLPLVIKNYEAEETPERRSQLQAERDAKDHNEKKLVHWTLVLAVATIVLAGLTLLLAMVAGGQLYMFWKQLNLMREGIDDAKQVALATKTQSDSIIRAERAYVKMSHLKPGFNALGSAGIVSIEMKNYGQTPARIIHTAMKFDIRWKGEDLPAVPDYSTDNPGPSIKAFLVRDESFTYSVFSGFGEGELDLIQNEKKILLIYGYVDYIDSFGGEHRAGYGRQYAPAIDNRQTFTGSDEQYAKRNNLFFITDQAYNYDHFRKELQGSV